VKHDVYQGSICGPLFFLFNISDLPKISKVNSKPVRFADDTCLIITNASLLDFKKDITTAFVQLKKNNLMLIHYF